jgi:hypothetical protein
VKFACYGLFHFTLDEIGVLLHEMLLKVQDGFFSYPPFKNVLCSSTVCKGQLESKFTGCIILQPKDLHLF